MKLVTVTHKITGEKFLCVTGTTSEIIKAVENAKGASDWNDPQCAPLIAAWNDALKTLLP